VLNVDSSIEPGVVTVVVVLLGGLLHRVASLLLGFFRIIPPSLVVSDGSLGHVNSSLSIGGFSPPSFFISNVQVALTLVINS